MTSAAYRQALEATGYLASNGLPAPGLVPANDPRAAKMRAIFSDERVGLRADAVFSAQNAPTSIFKDAGDSEPSDDDLRQWHEAAWTPKPWVPAVVAAEVTRYFHCHATQTDLPDRSARADLYRSATQSVGAGQGRVQQERGVDSLTEAA